MDRKKKPVSSTRQISQNKAVPYVPNRLDKSQPKSRSEKPGLGPPSLPEAITSAKFQHDELHNAILRKSTTSSQNGASLFQQTKAKDYFVHRRGSNNYHQANENLLPSVNQSLRSSMEVGTERTNKFVYYGHQTDTASSIQSPLPTAEFIRGKNQKLTQNPSMTNTQPAPYRRVARSDEEPIQSIIIADSETGSQKKLVKELRQAEYDLEERMNHNLMKQFKGMFDSEEAGIAAQNKNGHQNRHGLTPNIYNFINDQDDSSDDCGVKDFIHSNAPPVGRAPGTAGEIGSKRRSGERIGSSQNRQVSLSKTTQNFMPSNKLPPRARNTPTPQTGLVSNIRSKQILKKSQAPATASTVSKRPPAQLSANKHTTQASTAQVTNSSSDIMFQKGARSNSRKDENNQRDQNFLQPQRKFVHVGVQAKQMLNSRGVCARHRKMKCDICSRGDNSDQLSSSSRGSAFQGKFRSNNLKNKSDNGETEPDRQIGSQGKLRAITQRKKVKSLPREEMLMLGRQASNKSVNQTMVVDVRESHKFQQESQSALTKFVKSGNRPSAIPKPQNFQISKVHITMAGSARNTVQQYGHSNSLGRQREDSESNEPVRIPRIFSSKTNVSTISAMQRLERQKTLQQSNPGDLINDRIKKINQEWQNCDPHDEQFWDKQHGNKEQGRSETLRAMQVKNQQMDVLSKQSEVFRELRMEEDLNSEIMSLLGYAGPKSRLRSSSGNRGQSEYQSNIVLVPANNQRNLKAGTNQHRQIQSFRSLNVNEVDERIMTEIDYDEQQTFNHMAKQGNVASQAVFTDYDIADEVPANTKPPDFIQRNKIDDVKIDNNIEDLTKKKAAEQQYWTALQSSSKGDVYDVSIKQASLVRETEEVEDSVDEMPSQRITKCNITSYDAWLEQQAAQEQQNSIKSRASIKTADITSHNVRKTTAGLGLNQSNGSRPKTQGSQNTRNETVASKAKIERIRQSGEEVEVVLEKVIVLKQGVEVEVERTKNPDMIYKSGTVIGEFISQENISQDASPVRTCSQDELVYSQSISKSKNVLKQALSKDKLGPQDVIKEETIEDTESAIRRGKSPLKEMSPISPKQTRPIQSNNVVVGNINRHLRDFLHFEDGDDDGRKKVAAVVSIDQEQISELIANIDYNVSQEGMSASFYRIKERHEHSHLSMFDARPGAESIKTMMQQASPKIGEVQAVERTQQTPTRFPDRQEGQTKAVFEVKPKVQEHQSLVDQVKESIQSTKIEVLVKNEQLCQPTLVIQVDPTPLKTEQSSRPSSKSPNSRLHTETVSSQLKRLEKMTLSKEKKPPLLIKRNAANISPTKFQPSAQEALRVEPLQLQPMSVPSQESPTKLQQAEIQLPIWDFYSPKACRQPREPLQLSPADRTPDQCTDDDFCAISDYPQLQQRIPEPQPDAYPYLNFPYPPKPFRLPVIEPDPQEQTFLQPNQEPQIPQQSESPGNKSHYVNLETIEDLAAKCRQRPSSSYTTRSKLRRPMTANSRSSIGMSHAWITSEKSPQREIKPFTAAQIAVVVDEETKSQEMSTNRVDVNKASMAIQTNAVHFAEIEGSIEFQIYMQEKIDSQDWALSCIYDDVAFAKVKHQLRQRVEHCGNQVDEEQIDHETSLQILSDIECDYNADMLKKKMSGKDRIDDGRLLELYTLGMNTLKALMCSLRLQREWEFQSATQYHIDVEDSAQIDPSATVKLLTRCRKMYDAKAMVKLILKMIVQRENLVKSITMADAEMVQLGDDLSVVLSPRAPMLKNLTKEKLDQVRRMSDRIGLQVNALQEEHRIFKRPFILKGREYLEAMKQEGAALEETFNRQFFVKNAQQQ